MAKPEVPIEVDEATGVWTVDGMPMVLVPRHFLVNTHRGREAALGIAANARMAYEAGHKSAWEWCEKEAKTHGLSGVDIGGTFTDLALAAGGRLHTLKVLTTPDFPERAVLDGLTAILAAAGLGLGEVGSIIHGTTLATNALLERKGATTALLTTAGFRDSVEIGTESRFEQYDIFLDKPAPLVPRRLRLPVEERIGAAGQVLLSLDRAAVE